MRYGDSWAGGLAAVVGAIALWAAWGLEFWSEFGPGPGFMPVMLGAGLVIMGTSVAIVGWPRRERAQPFESPSFGSLRKPLLVAALLAMYLALLGWLGFAVATALFVFALLYWVEARRFWFALALATGITLGLHVVFVTLLNTSLPAGVLAWIS